MSPEALKGIAEYITNMADKIAEFTKSPWFYVLVTLAVLGAKKINNQEDRPEF